MSKTSKHGTWTTVAALVAGLGGEYLDNVMGPARRQCPGCGVSVSADTRTCPRCGADCRPKGRRQ